MHYNWYSIINVKVDGLLKGNCSGKFEMIFMLWFYWCFISKTTVKFAEFSFTTTFSTTILSGWAFQLNHVATIVIWSDSDTFKLQYIQSTDFTIFNQAKWQIDHNCIIHNVAQSYSIRFVYIRCAMQWKAIKYLNRMDWCRREWAWVNERTQNNLLCGTRMSIRFSFDRIYLFAVSISEYQNAYTM